MVAVRKNVIISMVGANGTGKTSVTKEIIRKWKDSRKNTIRPMFPKQGVCNSTVVFDVLDQLSELTDFKIKKDQNWAKSVDDQVRDSFIILDDYKLLVDKYTPTEKMIDLFINRRHHDNDYLYSCHSPLNVLPQIVPFTTHFYIFYTKATGGTWSDRLPFADLLIAASSYVNKYVSLNGLGKHPNDPEFWSKENNGQRFPYCIVNTDGRGTITGVNMNRRFLIEKS